MNEDELELGHYGRIFRRNWWMFALAVPACMVITLLLLPAPQTFFTSTVSVLLSPGDSDLGTDRDPINEDAEVGIAVSALIGDRVVNEWGDSLTLDLWRENLLVTACLDSDAAVTSSGCNSGIIEFSYRGESRAEAGGLAQLSAEQYLAFRLERETEVRETQLSDLNESITEKELEQANATQEVELAEAGTATYDLALNRLRETDTTLRALRSEKRSIERDIVDPGGLLGNASTPVRDSAGIPRPISLVVGAMLGLMLAAVAAVLTDRLDRRVTSPEEIEADLGVPVLGKIPRITQDTPALVTAVGEHSMGADAFRRLAAAALVPRNGYVVDSVAVASANEKEGRTTVAVNMALAFAQSGREVLLIAADRRNTAIDQLFGLKGQPGLNDFLRSSADIEIARSMISQSDETIGIRVVGTGTGTPPPMSSRGLAAILAAASERNMMVVFDSPPSLSSADGLQLASIADAVFVVAASGKTRRSELNDLRVQLLNVQADLAGAILNETSRMSLLPAGAGDVSAVRNVPSGVPGNKQFVDSDDAADADNVHSLHTGPRPGGPPQASPVKTVDADEAEVIEGDFEEFSDR